MGFDSKQERHEFLAACAIGAGLGYPTSKDLQVLIDTAIADSAVRPEDFITKPFVVTIGTTTTP